MPFTGPGVLLDLRDDQGILVARLSYQGAVDHYDVPSGFRTDFASVPKPLQGFVQALGKWTRPAILHDWFCSVAIAAGLISSRDADGIFRRTMREAGVGPVRRWQMWTAVRWASLRNPVRRDWPGFYRDLPALLAITVLDLAALTGVVYGIHLL